MPGQRPIRDPLAAITLSITWAAIAFVGLAYAVFLEFLDDSACERGGDSNYGDFRWSLLPPGPVCTWTEERNGFAARDSVGLLTSVWLLALLVLGFMAVRAIKRLYASEPKDGPDGGATMHAQVG